MVSTNCVWFQTDDAWDFIPDGQKLNLPIIDVRKEARALRFITSASQIKAFDARHASKFRPFTLYGSGDFHHLSALWMRQFQEPFTLLSFDNHPDWDIRPPRWSCGAWINRALENPRVQQVSIWGCGNFECNFPWRLLGNRSVAREGRLRVHPWAQNGKTYPSWLSPLTSETWKSQFAGWVAAQSGHKIYVTIDMDCLFSSEVVTNWENGRFTCDDLLWALHTLREKAEIIGGDLCGAWSQPNYQTAFQWLAGWFDHPPTASPPREELISRNLRAFQQLWPALTGSL